MDEIRINRVRSMIKDELSVIVNRELKDPRIPFVTVTDVKMTRDAKQATVFISILNLNQTHAEPELMESCLEALTHAKGYLKKHLSAVLQMRHTPELLFREDKGLENTLRVNEILKQLTKDREAADKAAGIVSAPAAPLGDAPSNREKSTHKANMAANAAVTAPTKADDQT
jgi:ribosome-binding factor A